MSHPTYRDRELPLFTRIENVVSWTLMTSLLANRVSIVTGGSSGIGRGIALEFAREGATVVVADVQEAPKVGKFFDTDLTTTTVSEIERLGARGEFAQTDVTQDSQVENLIVQTVERYGRLDILVNNVGIYIPGDIHTLSTQDWDRMTQTNYRSVYVACKHAATHVNRSAAGRIINIASVQAFAGGGGPAYPGSKAAVVNFTRDLALQLAPNGTTVNAICPGFIETPVQDYQTSAEIEMSRKRTPLPRFGTPRDIGRAAVFLASDDAEWITGTCLTVDGGWRASVF